MSRLGMIRLAFAIIILGASILFYRTWSKKSDSSIEESTSLEQRDSFNISAEVLKKHPVKTVFLKKEGDYEQVIVPGTVSYDLGKVARVGSRVSGRLVHIYVNEGDHVKKGQTIFSISSVELGEMESLYKKSIARKDALLIQSERAKELYEKKVTSAKEYEMTMMEYQSIKTEAENSRNALENYGLTSSEIGSLLQGKSYSLNLPIRSPISGTVTERNAVLGQAVSARDNLFTVADLSSLWIILEVYEKDLNQIKIGNSAFVTPIGSEDEPIKAKTTHVGEVIDPVKRSAEVRLMVKNIRGQLRPGQSVSAVLQGLVPSHGEKKEFYTIPSKSVHKIEGESIVFIQLEDGSFQAKKVTIGRSVDDRLEVLDGVSPTDRIVTDGSFLLKSEYLKI